MRLIAFLMMTLLGLFLSPAFAVENNSSNSTDNANQVATAQNPDNEVVAWLMTLNQNEIAAAKEVLKRKVNPQVKAYAQQMVKDHSANLKATLALSKKDKITPAQTDAVVALKQKGQEELDSLKALKGKEFELAYMNAMVEGHSNALKGLDEKIQSVTNPDLKKFLEKTRKTVSMHLAKATAIKSKID